MKKLYSLFFIVAIALFLLLNSVFTVDQTKYALILQFGDPIDVKRTPGLHFKLPFIQNVIYLDNRLMEYDVDTTIIYTNDKKNMVVDAYVRWRIDDPLLFYKRFKGDNSFSIIEDAKRRLGDVIIGELKSALGHNDMSQIISGSRGSIMEQVTESTNKKLSSEGDSSLMATEAADIANQPASSAKSGKDSSGLKVVDVRIIRADLPPENQKSVHERMKAERDQQAMRYRSEGKMKGQKITAEADRKKVEVIAQANRTSLEVRGKADAEAAKIYADAYQQDPEFFMFLRSLDSYRTALKQNSTLVLSPESSEYFKYLGNINPHSDAR